MYRQGEDRRLRTEPSTSTSAAGSTGKKRVEELTIALRHSELTAPAYITTAFNFPEVIRVEIHKFRDGWDASKVEELLPGFDAQGIERYLLDRYKAGSYRFSIVVDDRSLAWRTYSFGDAPLPAANGHASGAESTAVTGDQVLRDIAKRLEATMTASQLSGMVSDLEAARTNRELAPQKMLLEALGALIAKAGAPAPSDDRMVDLLVEQLRELRQELREVRTAGVAKPADSTSAGATRLGEELKAVLAVGELLGLRKGGPAPAAPWITAEAVKTAVDAAAPIIGRGLDLLEARLSSGPPARAALPTPGGTASMPTGDQALQLPAEIREAIDALLEALRSRDFTTVAWMLDNVFVHPTGEPMMPIDPDVNPLAYVLKLRPLAPKINDLRAELVEFLAWVKARRAAGAPSAASA